MGRRKGDRTLNRDVQPEGRGKIWAAIRFLKRNITLEDLESVTGQSYPNVRRYVRRLQLAGYLRLDGQSNTQQGKCNVYRLVRNSGRLAPIPQFETNTVYDPNTKETFAEEGRWTAQDAAWEFARRGEPFTTFDLQKAARMQRANALKWVAALEKAKYLEVVEPLKTGPGGHPAKYRLVKDTGCVAPKVRRSGKVVDANLEMETGDGDTGVTAAGVGRYSAVGAGNP